MISSERSPDSSAIEIPLPVQIGVHVDLELIDDQGNREPLAVAIVKAQAADLAAFITAAIEGSIILGCTYHTGDPLRRVGQELVALMRS